MSDLDSNGGLGYENILFLPCGADGRARHFVYEPERNVETKSISHQKEQRLV
jgi:hypothetical protein